MYIKICEVCGKKYTIDDSYEAKTRRFCSRFCYLIHHKGEKVTINCLSCGKAVTDYKRLSRKYCSQVCSLLGQRVNKVKRTCRMCSKVFETIASKTHHKYCDDCRIRNCLVCSRKFIIKPKSKNIQKICSRKCASLYYSQNFSPEQREKLIAINKIIHTGRKRSFITRIRKSLAMMGSKNHRYINGSEKKRTELYESIFYRDWRDRVFGRDNYTCQHCGAENGNGKRVILEAHHIKRWSLNPELRFVVENGIILCRNCHLKESQKESKIYWKNQYSSNKL